MLGMETRDRETSAMKFSHEHWTMVCSKCSCNLRAPLAADIWKIFSDPILTIYSNLEDSSHNLHFLLRSILKCNREISDLFIPTAYDQCSRRTFGVREEQYKAFASWLLGHMFYINGQQYLNQLHASSVKVQIKCVRAISFQSNHIFTSVFEEYILVIQDLLDNKVKYGSFNRFTLKRFIPNIVDVGDGLKLCPIYVEVSDEKLAKHLMETVLQILEGIIDGMSVLSENLYVNVIKVIVRTIKKWDTPTQAVALKVATALYKLNMAHLNEQMNELFCTCVGDLVKIVIPFSCPMGSYEKSFCLIDCLFDLFNVMLRQERPSFQHRDIYLIKVVLHFLEMECMQYYTERRLNLLSLLSSCFLSNIPAHLLDNNVSKEKIGRLDSFLCAIYSLEHCVRSEVLGSLKEFVGNMQEASSEMVGDLRWSAQDNSPAWKSIVNWYRSFSSADLKNFPLYFAAVVRLSSHVIRMASKLSTAISEITSVVNSQVEVSFFDGLHKNVFFTFVNVLDTLSSQDELDSESKPWETVFHGIGTLLRLTDYVSNVPGKDVTCVEFLSLPWDCGELKSAQESLIEEEVFSKLRSRMPEKYRTSLRCISFRYLGQMKGKLAFPLRCSLLDLCFKSQTKMLISEAIKSVPFFLMNDSTEMFAKNLIGYLDDSLESNDLDVQQEISNVIPSIICTLAGSAVIRDAADEESGIELVCRACCSARSSSPEVIISEEKLGLLSRLLELLESKDSEVKLKMVDSIPVLTTHLDIVGHPQLLEKCLSLLEDANYNVRLKTSEIINHIVFPKRLFCEILREEASSSPGSCISVEYNGAVKWFNNVYGNIFDIVMRSLMKTKKEYQETNLFALEKISSVKWDVSVFPVVKLFIIFLIHPSSAIYPMIPSCFVEFCKRNNRGPMQLFERFQVEICKLISCVTVLSMSRKNFRLLSAVEKISFMFEFGSPGEFLQANLLHLLPPLFPWMAKKRNDSIVNEISFFLMTNPTQLLTKQFRYIYSYLYLNEDDSTFDACMDYLSEIGSFDVSQVKTLSSESIQNQLILDLHSKPDRVLNGLAELMADEGKPCVNPRLIKECVADFLQPRILGILLFLDSLLTAPMSCHSTKKRALCSLREIIKLMGPHRLTPIKLKILTTLKTCLRMKDGDFPSLTCDAWEAFVHNVELTSLGSLLSQIFISLLPLIDRYPEKIVGIFRHLVIENGGELREYLPDLYFVQDHQLMGDVYRKIQGQVNDSWPEDFREGLTLLLKYITHDHVDVKVNGLKKLRQFLKGHQTELKDFVLNFGNEDTILADLIEALIIGCRDRDPSVRVACGECFGEIGAIDSARLPRSTHQKDEKVFIFDVRDEEFAVCALTKFLKAFMSARDTADMDRFALAIQVFLKAYLSVIPSEAKKKLFWKKFPESMQQIMIPFQSTRYVLESEMCDLWKPHPIYGSSAGTSFQNWAYRWVCNMLTIEDDEFKLRVLYACRACMKCDMNVLIFLLPHIFLNAVIKANEEQSWKLVEEILAVMSTASLDSKESVSTEEVRPIILRSCIVTETRADSPKEMRVMCLNTVFSLIDYLAMWVREFNSLHGKKDSPKDDRPAIIKSFLCKISKLTIANRNFECHEYPRSLLYLEQFVSVEQPKLEEQSHFFEKIYARLNEPDAVAGVLAVQRQPWTLEQMILSHEANGQLQDAFTCYEEMAERGFPETGYAMGMVNCQLKLDSPRAALELIKGLSVKRPDLSELLIESSVEALWKMSDWTELEKCLKSTNGLLGNLWGVSVGNALLSLRGSGSDKISLNVDSMREALMSSLCAISIDKGAYERGYQFIVRSQILSEIEKGSEIISSLHNSHLMIGEDIIKRLLREWDGKLKFVQDSMSTLEPILSVRRIILGIINENVSGKNPVLSELLENEIGRYWIKSAEIARNSGYFQQSNRYILKAERYNIKNAFIERAKLFWDMDNTNHALSTLRKGIAKTFPNASQFKVLKDRIPAEDRKTCAEAKLLLARLNDENINAGIDDNMHNYKDSVETYTKWEKNLVYLAQYYDRVLDTIMADDVDKGIESQLHMINYFGKSLEFGCEYMFHSMPRMLTIWLDYGTKISDAKDRGEIFVKMTKLIETYAVRLPPFMFFSAFSQITTRLCHRHPLVYPVLKNIITKVIITYPHQSLWMIMAVYKSSNSALARRCSEIFSICKKKDSKMVPIINDYIKLTDQLIALCNKQVPEGDQSSTLAKLSPSLSNMFKCSSHSRMSLPLQKFISITMPMDQDTPQSNHNPFPKEPVYITSIEDKIYIFQSLQKPKKISFRGSDGKQYTLLCKSKDDLRKDLRVMEFNRIVNTYLQSDAEACQRFLHIRTYSVVPLNEDCGVIEWVPNLIGLRSLLTTLYSKMGIPTTTSELKRMMCALKDPLSKKKMAFLDKLIPRHPPVFDLWFYRNFSDPQGWYMARNAYTRTTAVMSIVGYVLGLGDRHGENVMFDSTNGDTVHVDLSCIFNMGEKFNWPERVPFRLTHNMVKAMGPNGIEGLFRRACEITLKILKRQSNTLIAVLTPFVYDPSMSSRGASVDSGSHEVTNKVAREHLNNISQRLQGYVSMRGGSYSLPLSTEGQVETLISEATSVDNLCQMYIGWGAYL